MPSGIESNLISVPAAVSGGVEAGWARDIGDGLARALTGEAAFIIEAGSSFVEAASAGSTGGALCGVKDYVELK